MGSKKANGYQVNQEPGTKNLEPRTRNQEPETRNPEPKNPELRTNETNRMPAGCNARLEEDNPYQ